MNGINTLSGYRRISFSYYSKLKHTTGPSGPKTWNRRHRERTPSSRPLHVPELPSSSSQPDTHLPVNPALELGVEPADRLVGLPSHRITGVRREAELGEYLGVEVAALRRSVPTDFLVVPVDDAALFDQLFEPPDLFFDIRRRPAVVVALADKLARGGLDA